MSMTDTVVALIVDVVNSRQLKDRVGAQQAIRSVFDDAGRKYPAFGPCGQLWGTSSRPCLGPSGKLS